MNHSSKWVASLPGATNVGWLELKGSDETPAMAKSEYLAALKASMRHFNSHNNTAQKSNFRCL